MLTSSDINKLKEVFATKKDLERFATKEDLEGFATKKDLERFATKEDLKVFATKKDLERFATKEVLIENTNDLLELIQLTSKELKNDIASLRVEILHEIKGLREDITVLTKYKDITEIRLTKLEQYNHITS